MASACPDCGFPLDPGAACASCALKLAPRRMGTGAFDKASTRAAIAPPVAGRATSDTTPQLRLRAAAFAIDLAFVGAIVVVYLVFGAFAYGLSDLRAAGGGNALEGAARILSESPRAAIACGLLLFVVTSGYFVWFQGAESRTPGMSYVGLRVVRADGSALGMWGALSRWGAFLIALALFGLGLLWTAFSDAQRGLHDHLSGTSVRRA